MKDTLLFQAEESARLSKEEKVLEKKLVKIKESHRLVWTTYYIILYYVCTCKAKVAYTPTCT